MILNNNQLIEKLSSTVHSRNPFEIAQALGCIVQFVPLVGIRGFHQYIKRTNIIYIDSNLEENQAKFVCAHELGHMLLHKKVNRIFMTNNTLMVTSKYEIEADRFAVDLLYPTEDFWEYREFSVYQIAQALGLPVALVEYKLRQLGEENFGG